MAEHPRISVRALVERFLRSGDLRRGLPGPNRPDRAIRAHRKLQRSRGEGYQAEAPISLVLERSGQRVEVSGRMDGLLETPQGVLIEEIKTTRLDLSSPDLSRPVHLAQLKSYAYLVALDKGLEGVETLLTYHHLETGKNREIRNTFGLRELEGFFNPLLDRYLDWSGRLQARQEARDKSLQELEFPLLPYRPGQRALAVEVFRAVRDRERLLAQAPTGIGKTLGVLFPALKALGEGLAQRIFFLTARTTGQEAAEIALGQLRSAGVRARTLTITARDKVCPFPEAVCDPLECEHAKGHFDRIDGALEALAGVDHLSRERIARTAAEHRVCPFELTLDLALEADVVVCDYNYLFDPKVFLRRFFLASKTDYVFLVDEAHNLVERARGMFSARIEKRAFLDLRRRIKETWPEGYKQLSRINTLLLARLKACGEKEFTATQEPPEEILKELASFQALAEARLARNPAQASLPEFLDLYFAVRDFVRVGQYFDQDYLALARPRGRDLDLTLFCLDPSARLEGILKKGRAAVFFSATLSPGRYFQRLLGRDREVRELALPSPFPERNLGVFVLDSLSTFYRRREVTKTQVALAISALVLARPGNYLIYFPSYEYLELVRPDLEGAFSETGEGLEMIAQEPAMDEPTRAGFLARFKTGNKKTLVGLAVLGGIFGEGIDLTGERLTGAVVVGVGLPGLSPRRELIRSHFQASDRAGFEFAYLYPGLNRVLQAAGRVIRSESDQGVVLLIDQRFRERRYARLLPPEWRIRRTGDEADLTRLVREFWGGLDRGTG